MAYDIRKTLIMWKWFTFSVSVRVFFLVMILIQINSHLEMYLTYLSLGNQLAGIKLGNDSLQHLSGDRWQNALIVINSQNGVDLGQLVGLGSEENTQCDVDVLQILAASNDWNVSGLRTNVEENGPLDPRNDEMGAFADNQFLDALEPIEDDRSVTTIDYKQIHLLHYEYLFYRYFHMAEYIYTNIYTRKLKVNR